MAKDAMPTVVTDGVSGKLEAYQDPGFLIKQATVKFNERTKVKNAAGGYWKRTLPCTRTPGTKTQTIGDETGGEESRERDNL